MCRLFAFVSPHSSDIRSQIGDTGMQRLTSLARLHGDGWGWAGVDDLDGRPTAHKSAGSAVDDPAFERAATTSARAAMVHLRWATSGLEIADRNAHPFLADGLAFEHNGSLTPIDTVRQMLSAESRASMLGETDSEMYFTLIREQIALGIPLLEATARVVRRLRTAYPLASLNAILLGDGQMIVVRASARSILSDDDLDEIALHPDLPDEHNEDYFALRWTTREDGTIVIGSTGVAGYQWEELPPESVTAISLDDLTSRTVALDAGEH